jgi:hypothetical protein
LEVVNNGQIKGLFEKKNDFQVKMAKKAFFGYFQKKSNFLKK